MADLTLTATSVVQSTNPIIITQYTFGETVTAGMPVYLNTSDSKWYKAQNDGTSAESGYGTKIGVALNGGAANQSAAVQVGGNITIGGTIAVGVFYYLSATAGGICPVADVGSAKYVTVIGYGATTSVMTLNPIATGLTLA